MANVLLIDDDVDLLDMLKKYFECENFAVAVAYEAIAGLELALSGKFDLIMLDIMMPSVSGIELLRKIRQQSQLPILMLTARGDDSDRVIGLELGADDYVTKPCSPRELTARFRAILRRTSNPLTDGTSSETLRCNELVLWPEKRLAKWKESKLDLTSAEFNLLEILVRHAGHPVSKQELSAQGLGREMSKYDRNVDVHLSSLRQKLGTMRDGRSWIQTVYRLGYQFIKE
jgi:DNA-binding response OmpR family regulator